MSEIEALTARVAQLETTIKEIVEMNKKAVELINLHNLNSKLDEKVSNIGKYIAEHSSKNIVSDSGVIKADVKEEVIADNQVKEAEIPAPESVPVPEPEVVPEVKLEITDQLKIDFLEAWYANKVILVKADGSTITFSGLVNGSSGIKNDLKSKGIEFDVDDAGYAEELYDLAKRSEPSTQLGKFHMFVQQRIAANK